MSTHLIASRRRPFVPILVLGLALSACATATPPRESLGAADQALRSAEEAGVTRQQSEELRRAEAKLGEARDLVDEQRGDAASRYTRARWLAEEARVDAQVAEARSRARAAERSASELEETVELLRSRLDAAPARGGASATDAAPALPSEDLP